MSNLDRYLHAATRENTRRSYQSAIEHFEAHWGGRLPATSDQIARYLADHAGVLAHNTLKLRLAALGQWHQSQGFVDPTKSPLVRKVLKGIRELHPSRVKQARPMQLETLERTCDWLDRCRQSASTTNATALRANRDKALLLIGFWRGFRSDEIVRLHVENIDLAPGEGLSIYLARSKTDRNNQGQAYRTPALAKLCPVQAYQDWLHDSKITEGPVFRGINRWNQMASLPMSPASVLPLLRQRLQEAGVLNADQYSSHSLRRGFANWATQQGWSLNELMEYVGWRDIQSAVRYLDASTPFETMPSNAQMVNQNMRLTDATPIVLTVELRLLRLDHKTRAERTVRKRLERFGLKSFSENVDQTEPHSYRLQLAPGHRAELDTVVDELLERLHSIASDEHYYLEAMIREPETQRQWE